jgi:nucleoside-diphosphate-sugar epimerase
MRVCILGAGGFIGRHLVNAFPESTALTHSHLNLLDSTAVNKYFTGNDFDVIVHCASVGGSRLREDDQSVYIDNMNMFTNVHKHAKYNKLIWFSSGASSSLTSYGCAKNDIEKIVKNYPNVFVVKIWGCFGPGEPAQRLLATGIREGRVVIQKNRLFSFVHVCDVVFIVKCIIGGYEQRMIHMVYPGDPVLLSEILDMAKIPYSVTENELDEPYTGTWNAELLKPVLCERILDYVSRQGV